MDVMQAIRERRTIRKYRGDPVPKESLQRILEAARWAPSWGNTQCLRLIVVQDHETKLQLAAAMRTSRPPPSENAAANGVREAAIVLVACAEQGLSGYYRTGEKAGTPATDKGEYWFMFDVGLAMQNVTLAAHALGLGTVHIGMYNSGKIAKILQIPENVVVVELMALGWPDETPPDRPRKETSEFVFYNRYGHAAG